MRKPAALALILATFLGSGTPIIAQKGDDTARVGRESLNRFDNVRAITDGEGVLVTWQMRSESRVAGYDVFRVGSGTKEKVNPTPVMGSAGRFRNRTAYGESYRFFDLDGQAGSEYVIQGRNLDGSTFTSTEASAVAVASVETVAGTSSAAFRTARLSTNSNVENRTSSLTGELQDLVSLYEQDRDPEMQRYVASRPGAKIAVKKDGFYRVTEAELLAANFPVSTDSTKWRLFMNGAEQAITVGPAGQYIEFYGRANDLPETDIRYYYLIADDVAGKRIGSKILRPLPGSATANNYPVRAVKKERTQFYNKFFNGEEENFIGRLFFDTPTQINFNLTGIDTTVATADIGLRFYGFSGGHHEVRAKLNGHELPAIEQDGYVFYSATARVPTSVLVEGTNTLELVSHAPSDFNLFDRVEVSYARRYVAEQNKISFFTPGYKRVDLAGFETPNVRVFDLTFDGNPVLISNTQVFEGETGYTARIPSSRMMVGYALENSALMQSPGVIENKPSNLFADSNRADMVIVSHSSPAFLAASETWADHRRSTAGGSHTVKVVDIADVYDEFNYGNAGAAALRAFLNRAVEEWATPPGYVLLMGDSTYDPRNYEGFGYFDLVPSRGVTLILEESNSDDSLVDFDDDGLASVSIGRIPARTAAQIGVALDKTKKYEQTQINFSNGLVLAHDLPLGFDFEGMSQLIAAEFPPGTPVTMVSTGETNAHEKLITALNQGPFLVNYAGHGSAGLWANSSFFNNGSVSGLTNAQKPSVYSMLTCLSGYFLRTNAESLSEVLLFHPTGGAAAAWASTSETTPDIQLLMGVKFAHELAGNEITRMGDLVRNAKSVIDGGADVRLSWVLLGDPAMKMP